MTDGPALAMTNDTAESIAPDELARLYGRHVFECAYRVLGNAAAAEDVQQDVFVRLIESPPRAVVSWPALLRASAVRLAIDRLRHHRRWRRWRALFGSAPPDPEPLPEADVERHQRATRLRAALAALPAREAQCFALRWIEGLELDAVSAATGLRPNTVSVALHRAARRLEQTLAGSTADQEHAS
jgi:RNA polymerase sigma-70 factor (ECF subfamily)